MKTSSQQDQWIREAAQKSQVPEQVIRSIMKIESGGRHYAANGQVLRSEQNALGAMQVLRGTAINMGVHNPENPRANIMAGAKYLSYLNNYLRANGNWAMVATAYHQGEGTVSNALSKARKSGNGGTFITYAITLVTIQKFLFLFTFYV